MLASVPGQVAAISRQLEETDREFSALTKFHGPFAEEDFSKSGHRAEIHTGGEAVTKLRERMDAGRRSP